MLRVKPLPHVEAARPSPWHHMLSLHQPARCRSQALCRVKWSERDIQPAGDNYGRNWHTRSVSLLRYTLALPLHYNSISHVRLSSSYGSVISLKWKSLKSAWQQIKTWIFVLGRLAHSCEVKCLSRRPVWTTLFSHQCLKVDVDKPRIRFWHLIFQFWIIYSWLPTWPTWMFCRPAKYIKYI